MILNNKEMMIIYQIKKMSKNQNKEIYLDLNEEIISRINPKNNHVVDYRINYKKLRIKTL